MEEIFRIYLNQYICIVCSISDNSTILNQYTSLNFYFIFLFNEVLKRKTVHCNNKKTYTNNNNNKQTNKNKTKNEKYKRKTKNINSNCEQLSLSLFHIWCIGYPDVPFVRYIYLVIWYLSPSRGKTL